MCIFAINKVAFGNQNMPSKLFLAIRMCIFEIENVAFDNRCVHFVTQIIAFGNQNVSFWSKNVAFVNQNMYFCDHKRFKRQSECVLLRSKMFSLDHNSHNISFDHSPKF